MAMSARTLEHGLALLLERRERRVGTRQRQRARGDGFRQRANAPVREQRALKRREIVEELLRRSVLDLCVIHERA